jgi:hypothetical protein
VSHQDYFHDVSTLEGIVEDLKALPASSLAEVAAYIHCLRKGGSADKRTILRETSGAWSAEDADIIEKAISESCDADQTS